MELRQSAEATMSDYSLMWVASGLLTILDLSGFVLRYGVLRG